MYVQAVRINITPRRLTPSEILAIRERYPQNSPMKVIRAAAQEHRISVSCMYSVIRQLSHNRRGFKL